MNILIIGGAGFIGSFLTDKLIELGHKVTILDNLIPQVHNGKVPSYLNKKAKFVKGDVRDYKLLKKLVVKSDIVFPLAARVGVQQSNYEISEYTDVNILGMANLLDIVVNNKTSVKKILMTASMTSYGEGDCVCKKHGKVKPRLRDTSHLRKKDWSLYCSKCTNKVDPIPTSEESPTNNNSIYALTKNTQEELLLRVGRMYKIPVVSFRCFNVYGPRQSLSNPYTGVTAIFISRLKNNNAPVVYEDGNQSRDFISVHDVVDALILGMKSKKADYNIFNLGSGKMTTINQVAITLANLLNKKIKPEIGGNFRTDDIRHCFADNRKVKKVLGWKVKVSLKQGFDELIAWSENEEAIDEFEKAQKELKKKSLSS